MNLKLRLSAGIYLANILFLIVTGLVFEFSSEFLSFHADVIQTEWQDVDSLSQTLYLGLMRTEAAGFLASGVAIAILILIPFRRLEQWSCWAMSAIGVVEYLPSLFANYHVASVSASSPPWQLVLTLIISLIAALIWGLAGMRKQVSEKL